MILSPPPAQRTGKKRANTFRVFLLEDHPVMRLGLRQLLEAAGMEVCGEGGSGPEALAALPKCRPDVIILDVSLGDSDGIALLPQLRRKAGNKARVLVYSMHDEPEYVERALTGGANGYLCKVDPQADLVEAIRQVRSTGFFLNPSMARRVADGLVSNPLLLAPRRLSPREREIFFLLGQGFRPAEISERLCLSAKTVETFLHRMKAKFGVNTSKELSRHAIAIHRSSTPPAR